MKNLSAILLFLTAVTVKAQENPRKTYFAEISISFFINDNELTFLGDAYAKAC